MKATANPTATANNVADEFREKATQVGEDLRALGTVTRKAAGEYYEQGLDKAKELEKTVETRIREHPLQSVGIAAGVGFLAGFLIGRR